jgi:hypothetical protein
MVAQDSQGFYGHDDLLSLSLSLKFLFITFFELLQVSISKQTFSKQ